MTTLRHGDRSQAVRDLQRKLNDRGAKLVADGAFGDGDRGSGTRLPGEGRACL